ncbi:MAG: hypothetical protein ACK48U_08345, partial [Planctomyces sp.]
SSRVPRKLVLRPDLAIAAGESEGLRGGRHEFLLTSGERLFRLCGLHLVSQACVSCRYVHL